VIDSFGASRLLSFDRDSRSLAPTVEVAHEALLTAWGRLRAWIDEAREDVRTERRLAVAAAEWDEAGRDPSFLATGSRLEQFQAWRLSGRISTTPEERDFLDASLAERDHHLAEAEAQEARERELERRSIRRLRALAAVLTVMAVVAAGLTVLAFDQRGRAEREERVAIARELAAASVANLEADPERSILLALEAVRRTRSVDGSVLPEVEQALHRAVQASRIVFTVPGVGGDLDWSADGLFVTEGPEETGLVDVRDAETGERVRSFTGHDVDINSVAFSEDGSLLATTGDDGRLRVWETESGRRLGDFGGESELVLGASFSPDGSQVAAGWLEEDLVRVWDVATGRLVRAIDTPAAPSATSFSPDGSRLAIGAIDEPVGVVVDVRSGRRLLVLEGHEFGLNDIDYSPDGRWISTASGDSTARIWDASSGRSEFTLFGPSGNLSHADWSPDSGRLVIGGGDGSARVWEISEGGARQELALSSQVNRSGVWGVAFSPDGERVMTGALDIGAVQVWDVGDTGDAEWANVPAFEEGLNQVAFMPDGRLVTTVRDGSLAVWDSGYTNSTRTLRPSEPFDPFYDAIDVSSDGELIAAVFAGRVAVWDASTGIEAFAVPGGADIGDVSWSPDGQLLALARFDDGLAQIVDRSGTEVASLPAEQGFGIGTVEFSPDGRLLATAAFSMGRPNLTTQHVSLWDWEDGTVRTTITSPIDRVAFDPSAPRLAAATPNGGEIWDTETGERVRTLTGGTGGLIDIAYSPDGSLIAAVSVDSSVGVWDARSGVQRLMLGGRGSTLVAVAFSPDGSRLASAGFEPTVRVWALDLDDLIEIAEGELTRDLTDEECRQYLHELCP
jgi:WD40 repeat protein